MRRLTIEFIKADFERHKTFLETTVYINNKQKLECICPNGHRYSITWNNWKTGYRCPKCAVKNRAEKLKKDFNIIKKSFDEANYILITVKSEYKNSKIKLGYICPAGHKCSMSWDSWRSGNRCPICAIEKRAKKLRKSFSVIRKSFESNNYFLVTTENEYKNSDQKLVYICPNVHHHSISWNNWRAGWRCPYCYGNGKPKIEFIKLDFEKNGWILKSTEYKNSLTKLECVCPNGHECNISWGMWQQGQRCSVCWAFSIRGSGNSNWQGGISKEPYCFEFTDDLKNYIKERDDYKCQNPFCEGNCGNLCVHHIDYNKKNCVEENLIAIGNSCNIKANYNREWWKAVYKEVMRRRGLC